MLNQRSSKGRFISSDLRLYSSGRRLLTYCQKSPHLLQEMLKGRVVLFAGAGISTEGKQVLPHEIALAQKRLKEMLDEES